MTEDMQAWNLAGLNGAIAAWFPSPVSQDQVDSDGGADAFLSHLAQRNDLTIAEAQEMVEFALSRTRPDAEGLRAA